MRVHLIGLYYKTYVLTVSLKLICHVHFTIFKPNIQIYFSHKAEQNVQEKFLYALLYAHNSCYCFKDLERVMTV